jgi:hypothetical protein
MCEGSKHSVGASESSTVVEICDNSRYWAGSDCWPKADMSNGSENWNGVGMRVTLEYWAEVAMKAASGYWTSSMRGGTGVLAASAMSE